MDMGHLQSGSLEEDFREHGRLSLLLLAAHLLIYVPINLRVRGDTLYSLGNLPIYALVALIAIAFISKRPRVQTISFCMFAAIQAYATLFIWAPEALG